MPKREEYRLHPWGWENDPKQESFRLSTLDYLAACVYNNYALFFKLDDDADRGRIALVIRKVLNGLSPKPGILLGQSKRTSTETIPSSKRGTALLDLLSNISTRLKTNSLHYPTSKRLISLHRN